MKTLKAHMKKYGLRVRDVSQMTGIPIRTVNAHLYGERQIGAKSALLYADGLGISLEQIIKDRVAIKMPGSLGRTYRAKTIKQERLVS